AVFDQLPSVAGQLAEFAEGRRRHETRPEQAMLQQPRDPLTILDIGLPPWNRLDVLGVDEDELEAALQNLVDGSPVDPGALHRHVGASGPQPASRRAGAMRAWWSRRYRSPRRASRSDRDPGGRPPPSSCGRRAQRRRGTGPPWSSPPRHRAAPEA